MSKPHFQFDKFITDLEEREARAQQQRQQDTRPETENPRRRLDAAPCIPGIDRRILHPRCRIDTGRGTGRRHEGHGGRPGL